MYIDPDLEDKVERFTNISQPNMGDALGIEYRSFKKDEVVASMPVDSNTIQPFGILHGGASVALAETLASIGAWLNIDTERFTSVGVEINANHIRAIKKGNTVSGTAVPIRRGSRIHVWEVRIHTDTDKLVCVARCTLAIVKNRSGG